MAALVKDILSSILHTDSFLRNSTGKVGNSLVQHEFTNRDDNVLEDMIARVRIAFTQIQLKSVRIPTCSFKLFIEHLRIRSWH